MSLKALKGKKKLNIKSKSQPKKVTPVVTEESQVVEGLDYTKPFRMIYSGVENEQYFQLLYDMGIRDFLMSYHYIKEKHINMSKFKGKNVKFFIDSGAHTYQNDPKFREYDIEYWEKHLQGYLKWAEKNREFIFAIASFDFENLVGGDVVAKWYREYFEPFSQRTGIPVCYVWHQDSSQDWEHYCQRYKYVGFSSVNTQGEAIDLPEYVAKLNIASKYNTLVHGFGMTRTSLLPKIPFYTCDSTTWLVGLQYGEINFWMGNKMSRLKKEKWKGEYLSKICELGVDRQKLLDEDPLEMVKANVKAFIEAEKFISVKLRPRMYWMKAKAVTQSLEDLEFPDETWLRAEDPPKLQDWAKKFNVNPDLEVSQLITILQDLIILLNWEDDQYKSFREQYFNEDYIQQLHDKWVNTVVTDLDQKISDLQNFYKECVEGNNDKLLHYGTGFDRVAKERDTYIEEETHVLEDMTEEELLFKLENSGMLPPPSESDIAPEITELDDEIFSNLDIVPVRDEQGRFVKGQKRVRKPKKIYSEKYPKLFCDTCYAAQTCPEYKQGMVCAFKKMFNRFDTRDMNDVMDAMNSMVEMNLQRLQRASLFEMMDGGIPTANVTNLINQNMALLKQITDMNNYAPREVIKQTRTVRSDGSSETVTQVSNGGASGGILDRLFADLGNAKEDVEEPKDIMAEKEALDEEEKKKAIDVEGKEVD